MLLLLMLSLFRPKQNFRVNSRAKVRGNENSRSPKNAHVAENAYNFFFRSFRVTISIQIEKSIDGVLGIRTRGRRIIGADETTELWRPPLFKTFEQNVFPYQSSKDSCFQSQTNECSY